MDAPANSSIRFNRLLPYWAVLQTDLRQTLQSWVYRLWVMLTVLAAGGAVLYKIGLHHEAGIVHSASEHSGELLRGLVAGCLGLVGLLAVTSVSAERGTVADAVLSRGISRHQYFLAKWSARQAVILSTFALLALGVLTVHHFAFDPDVTLTGGLTAVLMAAAALAVLVSWGVTIGALAPGTVMGITIFWLLLYGGFLAMSFLPGTSYPTPNQVVSKMKFVLRGQFEQKLVSQVLMVTGGLSAAAAVVGLIGFSRKDV